MTVDAVLADGYEWLQLAVKAEGVPTNIPTLNLVLSFWKGVRRVERISNLGDCWESLLYSVEVHVPL